MASSGWRVLRLDGANSCPPAVDDWYNSIVNREQMQDAIEQLTPEDLAQLSKWLNNYVARSWDREIESDLDAGRLDSVLAEVDNDCRAGLAKPL